MTKQELSEIIGKVDWQCEAKMLDNFTFKVVMKIGGKTFTGSMDETINEILGRPDRLTEEDFVLYDNNLNEYLKK